MSDELTTFELVGEFHGRFGFPQRKPGTVPKLVTPDFSGEDVLRLHKAIVLLEQARDALRESKNVELYRLGCQVEELHELAHAVDCRDLPAIADALADGAYFSLGSAHYYGIPFDEVFAEVHAANMAKRRGATPGRKNENDVYKPEGWTPPDVRDVLFEAGWRE